MKVGRPSYYNTPEELDLTISGLLLNKKGITMEGIALSLGFKNRQSLYDLRKTKAYADVLDKYFSKKPKIKTGIKFTTQTQYVTDRYHSDLSFKIKMCISSSIAARLKTTKKGKFRHLHYTAEDLVKNIESKFKKGMNWDNYGKQWHIDHVVPVSWFKIKDIGDSDFRQAWDLSNLKPEWKEYNMSKGNRFTENPQLKFTM